MADLLDAALEIDGFCRERSWPFCSEPIRTTHAVLFAQKPGRRKARTARGILKEAIPAVRNAAPNRFLHGPYGLGWI